MLMHTERDIVIANLSVCRPFLLPVTFWYCIETKAHLVKLLVPPPDRDMILVFFFRERYTAVTKFHEELPQPGH